MAFEEGNYHVAEDFLKTRLLDKSPGAWRSGATYNLARTYEVLAFRDHSREMLDKAIELYEQSDSPQQYGNILRARELKKLFQ